MKAVALILALFCALFASVQGQSYNATNGFYITSSNNLYTTVNAALIAGCNPIFNYFAGSVGLQCISADHTPVYLFVDVVDSYLNFSLTNSPSGTNFTCHTTDGKIQALTLTYDVVRQLGSGIGDTPPAQFLAAASLVCDIVYGALNGNF